VIIVKGLAIALEVACQHYLCRSKGVVQVKTGEASDAGAIQCAGELPGFSRSDEAFLIGLLFSATTPAA
jgi:undecaprenyl pyrophosphate phosphatase UppP